MDGLHANITTGPFFAGDLIGFTTGLLVTVLLLVLTLRAAKLPGTPLANIGFAVCALLWTAGGLMHTALLASGMPPEGRLTLVARAIQFTGAGAFPIPVLAIWRPFAVLAWQRTAARILQVSAFLSAGAIAMLVWYGPFSGATPPSFPSVRHFTAYSATLLLALGVVSLRRASTPHAVYVPSLVIVSAVCAASILMTMAGPSSSNVDLDRSLAGMAAHLVLMVNQ